jgi:hypothetical protein
VNARRIGDWLAEGDEGDSLAETMLHRLCEYPPLLLRVRSRTLRTPRRRVIARDEASPRPRPPAIGRDAQPHEVFTPPEDQDVAIWRYIDFTRLVSPDGSALFFARPDMLGDELEAPNPDSTSSFRRRSTARDLPNGLAQIVQFTASMSRHLRQLRTSRVWRARALGLGQ